MLEGEGGGVAFVSFPFTQFEVRPDLPIWSRKNISCSIYNKMQTEWVIPVSLHIFEGLKNFFCYRFIFFLSSHDFLYVILNFSYGVCGNQTMTSSIS